ncbi:piggyBac transposable element-derived protein 4-like [Euwallacea similis]|uniref:piggyBac transposable element-derived protein 4-like n=1 Tax=Euwallacea similis TaxID=1736056 RepID=UPI0034505505
MRPYERSELAVIVRIQEKHAEKFLGGSLHVSLVRCKLERYLKIKWCAKCWAYDHAAPNCNGADRRKCCFRCGKPNHRVKIVLLNKMCSWEDEQNHLKKLMEECLWEDILQDTFDDDDKDLEEDDLVETQRIDSSTEQEYSDSESGEEISIQGPTFTGKDKKTIWSKHPIARYGRTRKENLIKDLPGVKTCLKHVKKESEIFSHFFSDKILNDIVIHTNQHILGNRDNYQREKDAKITDLYEVKALIGLLYLSGVLKSNRLNLDEMWDKNGTGVELFRLTMPQQRFRFLMQHLRFDDGTTRSDRRQYDKLASIREVFTDFVLKCKAAYVPFENVTIDEKLEAFRGKCSFRQYIPSKPTRYELKVFALVDSKTFFTLNLEVYLGRQPEGPFSFSNSPKDVVMKLCDSIKGTGRNITVDNWFTSMELLQTLKKDFNLTLIGTIRKNKRELPQEFTRPINRLNLSSMFAFHNHATLVSFIPKKNKNVLLVSSTHHDDKIDENTGKPEIILDYNATKGEVDCVDKLCAAYDVSRNTRRWPMVLFYSLLNVAGINSYVVYSINNSTWNVRRQHSLNICNECSAVEEESE